MEVGFHIRMRTDELPQLVLESIRKNLTSHQTDYITKEKYDIEYFWEDREKGIIQIPGCFPIPIPDNVTYSYEPGMPLNEKAKLKDGFKYREGQQESINDALSNNVLTLMKPPGSGKTIIGSSTILKRGVRSLIIVDQDNLREQWINALNLVSDNTLDVYYEGLTFEKDDKELNHDVYVQTIQGILAKIRKHGVDYLRENLKKFHIGHVLLDEVHCLIGPEKFSLLCHVINPTYCLALSATPKDDIFVSYWLGHIIVGDKKYSVKPKVIFLDFNPGLNRSKNYICFGGRFSRDKYAKLLYHDRMYSKTKEVIPATYPPFISSIAYKTFLAKRNVLVICNYNASGVDDLVNELQKFTSIDNIGKYIAGCDKEVEGSKPIIVSNYKMLQKGTDIPTLDTLIMADPCANVTGLEQTIGRILRVNKGVTKKELLVFDITDNTFGDAFVRWKSIRIDFYHEKGFDLVY